MRAPSLELVAWAARTSNASTLACNRLTALCAGGIICKAGVDISAESAAFFRALERAMARAATVKDCADGQRVR